MIATHAIGIVLDLQIKGISLHQFDCFVYYNKWIITSVTANLSANQIYNKYNFLILICRVKL